MTHQLFLAHNPSFLLFSEELFSDTRLNLFNQVNQFVQFTKSIKNNLIMQNKPNLTAPQMNISSVLTKHYENKPRLPAPPKQTQSNPIPPPLWPNYHLTIHHSPSTIHHSPFTIHESRFTFHDTRAFAARSFAQVFAKILLKIGQFLSFFCHFLPFLQFSSNFYKFLPLFSAVFAFTCAFD